MSRTLATLALLSLAACGAGPFAGGAPPGGASASSPKEEAAPGGRVRNLLLRPTQTAPGLPSRSFAEGTTSVFCTFEVRGVAPGTAVTVHWQRGERELARNDLVAERDTRSLAAALSSPDALSPGDYQVEVRVAGQAEARTTFRVIGTPAEEQPSEGAEAPGVAGLTLTTSEDCEPGEGRAAPRQRTFRGSVRLVQLCLVYENIPRGQRLEVRWLQGTSATPLSTNLYRPDGSGDLASSFTRDPEIEPGTYHAAVLLEGREVGRASFVIRR